MYKWIVFSIKLLVSKWCSLLKYKVLNNRHSLISGWRRPWWTNAYTTLNSHRNATTQLTWCDSSQLMWGVCRIIAKVSISNNLSNNPTISITIYRSAITLITHVYGGGGRDGEYVYLFLTDWFEWLIREGYYLQYLLYPTHSPIQQTSKLRQIDIYKRFLYLVSIPLFVPSLLHNILLVFLISIYPS